MISDAELAGDVRSCALECREPIDNEALGPDGLVATERLHGLRGRQVLERLDARVDDLRELTRTSAQVQVARQDRLLGPALFEVLEDRQRLRERANAAVVLGDLERRH